MEAFVLDVEAIGFGAALAGLLLLLAGAALAVLAGMSEGEKAGDRYAWAADPVPGMPDEAAPAREEFRRAA